MIDSADRPDSSNTDHASVVPAERAETTNGDESGTRAGGTIEQDGAGLEAVDREDAARQQTRAERFLAGRVL
jgi:hypothetical protein